MLKWIESTGRTEDAAIEAALAKLGMDRDDVSVEILERAKTGFLGIGSSPAKVKVTYEAPDPPAPVKDPESVQAAPHQPEPAAPEQKAQERKARKAEEAPEPAAPERKKKRRWFGGDDDKPDWEG